jgi:N-acetylglutamate synthase
LPDQLAVTAIRALEDAAMRAWPALERIDEAGWVLRFAGGYTRRANSATALAVGDDDLEARIAWCERQFGARGLPPIFRVLSASAPARLDDTLAAAGYSRADESIVMTLELAQLAEQPAATPLAALPLDAWLDLFDHLSAKGGAHRPLHRRLLHGHPGRAAPRGHRRHGRRTRRLRARRAR